MNQSKNFHETIKELEKKIGESVESLIETNLKYRSARDKIDQLSINIFNTKVQILELTDLINDLLTKLDLNIFAINTEDLKKLTNVVVLRLINHNIRFLNTKF